MAVDLFGCEIVEDVLLRDKFIEPPFSVLDSRQGGWQARKRKWAALGIKSEVGRNAPSVHCPTVSSTESLKDAKYTSIFDPALTELMYHWFCPEAGDILDPFAGGSVRGVVANYLGFFYTGIELRPEQVESNREQALSILPVNNQPNYYCGDSEKVLSENWQKQFDFLFSCPPYADLEVYSDLPEDLSNMTYDKFLQKYEKIIEKSCKLLKQNAFACFVVGEVRDKKGYYYDFVSDTKKAFIKAGMRLYNDAILLNVVGSASMRAAKVFESGKKLTKIHQNVLVFRKEI